MSKIIENKEQNQKQHINLVVIGHVDSGKSTILGQLLYKCQGIDKKKMEQIASEAEQVGQAQLKYAWVLDKLKSERERGCTIDISLQRFETQKYIFTLIDTPGHRDFIKNMISGTSSADAAILVLSAPTGEYELGFSDKGQTREHILLAYTLGVKQMLVCVNKMDDKTVNYSESRFKEIELESKKYLQRVGYNPYKITYIPVSGLEGENFLERSGNLSWFKGQTLIQGIESLEPPKRPMEKPLRLPLHNVYKIGGIGTVPVGKVETGVLKVGQKLIFAPAQLETVCKSIEQHKQSVTQAIPGEFVGFNVQQISQENIKKGYVAGELNNDPPKEVQTFTASIIVMNHPQGIKKGYTPVVDCHACHIPCKFVEIYDLIDRRTGQVKEANPEIIKSGEACTATLEPKKPMCCECFSEYPPLGRIAIRDIKQTVAVGVIKSVKKKQILAEFKK